ncbi:MAG: flagellar assembly peptidoglycan hydrolase FlgJ [Pseudomonadota bacterium]
MQSAALYNDFGMLAGLRAEAQQPTEASTREVASQFEALFVQMMMKSMRDATPKGGLFNSSQLENYEQMYDQQLAMELSNQGGIGLADVIMRQFESTAVANDAQPLTQFHDLPNYRVPSMPAFDPAELESAVERDWDGSSPERFVESLQAHAEAAAQELGVDAQVLIAQAALETGWGKHVIKSAGRQSNNLFNIKASAGWDGEVARQNTIEFRDGIAVRESAAFRSYPSAQAAFSDYVDFIKSSPRYSEALSAASDGKQYLRELQNAGYATDPDYADKVISVLDRMGSHIGDVALKETAPGPITD